MDYLKTILFGSTSEICHNQLPGQLDLFILPSEEEPVPLGVEYIKVKAHKKDYTHSAIQRFLYCNKLFEHERSYREKGLSGDTPAGTDASMKIYP